MNCPICASNIDKTIRCTQPEGIFFDCEICGAIIRDPMTHVPFSEEKSRYLNHENSVENIGYLDYGRKVTDLVIEHPRYSHHSKFKILDFGSGAAELVKALLGDQHQVSSYDPHFFPDNKLLQDNYDVIIASEVVEHFNHPGQEWNLVSRLLKKDTSLLVVRTQPFLDHLSLQDWYYRRDPTHVIFYRLKTLDYISGKFDLGQFEPKASNIFLFVKIS